MTLTLASLLYLALVCLIYFNIRHALRIFVLTAASVVYVFFLSPWAGAAALITSVLTWLAGILTEHLLKQGHQKAAGAAAGCGIALAAGSLVMLKSLPLLNAAGWAGAASPVSDIIMPIGYSFYIFQVISYLADIYGGRTQAQKKWGHVLLYLIWFPKFISGPIERQAAFEQQVAKTGGTVFSDPERWKKIVAYILTGYIYKVVIADRLAIYVNIIFEHHEAFGSMWMIIGAIMYSFQIYCDFAGYSYAAVGISLIFDIELTQNFSMPYLSQNITEFWRRWHCSLSSWLRDYIYIPLGGNRKGERRKVINVIIVFLVCGLWHGAGAGFIIWGMLHGIYSLLDNIFRKHNIRFLREGFTGRVLTFLLVTFAWIFFRLPKSGMALRFITAMLTTGLRLYNFAAEFEGMGLTVLEISVIIVLLAGLLLAESLAYRHGRAVPELFMNRHYLIRWSAIVLLMMVIVIFGIYGPAYDSSRMIYMQF